MEDAMWKEFVVLCKIADTQGFIFFLTKLIVQH